MTHAIAGGRRCATEQPGRADITDRRDILELLRDFYARAFHDDVLGPVFVDVAKMDLGVHLPVICDFWETVLLHTGGYRRNTLSPHQRLHARAALTSAHFARWLGLWMATIDDRYPGPTAELAKLQGSRMAGAMSRRITGTGELGGGSHGPAEAVAALPNLRSWSQVQRAPLCPR